MLIRCHAATSTFDPLTLKFVVHQETSDQSLRNFGEIEQSPAELLVNFANFVTRCDNLDLWPLNLELSQHFGCHAFKTCTKFEQNRIIYGWVIDNLAYFLRTILGEGWALLPSGLRDAWPQLHRTWKGHDHDYSRCLFQSLGIFNLAEFSNACGSKLSDVLYDTKFHTFWPPMKIRGQQHLLDYGSQEAGARISMSMRLVGLGEGWAWSLYQLLKFYLRPNLWNTYDGHPLHGWQTAEHGRLILKKEKLQESSWLKLNAFRTNVG